MKKVRMSLTHWTVACEDTLDARSTPAPRAGCHPQSTDDWALRLHSCRALSSQPQNYYKTRNQIFKSPVDKPHTRDPRYIPVPVSPCSSMSKNTLPESRTQSEH